MRYIKNLKRAYKESSKLSFAVYIILRILVLITFIRQLMLREWGYAILCIIALILFLVPVFLEKALKIAIPSMLEIIIMIFIFSGEILGEINNFFINIPHFDTVLHVIAGFVCAGLGFSLVMNLNQNNKDISLSPLFISIVAFSFSMTLGVMWEFLEYGFDTFLRTDMQKDQFVTSIATVELDETKTNRSILIDNISKTILYDKKGKELAIFNGYLDIGIKDTMKDLLVNFAGAICFSVFGYLYNRNESKYKFVNNFFITKQIPNVKIE